MATRQTAFHERPEYIKGDTSQRLCAAFLQRHGWYVIPSYDFTAGNTKAPRMVGRDSSFVLPDLDVAKAATRRWVEVKYKRSANWTYITRQLEHGLARRLHCHYKRVVQETGCDLWLAVHEGVTELLLIRRVADLPDPRLYPGDKMDRGGTVFWPRDQFQRLASVPIPEPEEGIPEVRAFVRSAQPQLLPDRSQPNTGHRLVVPGRQATPTEQRLWHAYPNDILTLTHRLDLLPWFGPVGD